MAGRRASSGSDVDSFMVALEHPFKPRIEQLRAAVLASNDAITEHVKWNAPSFCHDGVDRVTFRLQPGNRCELIFHRGVEKRSDSSTFRFEDPTGLLEWAASDRAVLRFQDLADVEARQDAVVDLVNRWVAT